MAVNGLRELILRPVTQESDPLVTAIREVCGQLSAAEQRFSMESDKDLIEASIYETVSLEARYRYLLRLAKERGMTVMPQRRE